MGGKVKYDGCLREIAWGCRLEGELFYIILFLGVGLRLGSCRLATVMGAGDGMGIGGRERDILGNSKLTLFCHEEAGYVKGLVVGKRVSVGVRVRIIIRVGVWFWFGVAARVGERR